MFTWNDEERCAEDFTAFLSEEFDVSLCLLEYPTEDLCDQSTWGGAERGFIRAAHQTATKAAVLSTFSDTISETVAQRLMQQGIAMLAGIDDGLAGIRAAVEVGPAWKRSVSAPLFSDFGLQQPGDIKVLNETESKHFLARHGIPVPALQVVTTPDQAATAADELGYPVVGKA